MSHAAISVDRSAPIEARPLRDGSPATWGDSVANWESYLAEKAGQSLVFRGTGRNNEGEIVTAPYSHRFQQEYTRMQYAKIQGFSRGSLAEYEDPHLAILTLSTTTTTVTGEPRPPLEHMDELLGSWRPDSGGGVYYELNQVMEGSRKRDPWEPRPEWEYLLILEPTTNEGLVPGGYAHAHVGIVVDGAVEPERFESVIDAHLAECPGATADGHELETAIEVGRPADEEVRNKYQRLLNEEGEDAAREFAERQEGLADPGAYLFKYLGKSWDTEAMEDYEKRFAALLKESGRQRFRASNGAQRWMERDEEESESGAWDFAGIASSEQAVELAEYEDYEDFLIATGAAGLRSWLAKRRESVPEELGVTELAAWECDECSTVNRIDRCVSCGAIRGSDRPLVGPRGDRPPPNHET